LQPPWQDLARIPVEKLDVRIWFELCLGDGRVLGIAIELNAYDPSLWETERQHESASTAHPARFQDLSRGKPTDGGVKEKHSARTNSPKAKLTPHACDRVAEIRQTVTGVLGNRRYVQRGFIPRRAQLLTQLRVSAQERTRWHFCGLIVRS
jgi:hypothetical protein